MTRKHRKQSVAASKKDWIEYSNTLSWDVGDAMRTSAKRDCPKCEVQMLYDNGTYRVMVRGN